MNKHELGRAIKENNSHAPGGKDSTVPIYACYTFFRAVWAVIKI